MKNKLSPKIIFVLAILALGGILHIPQLYAALNDPEFTEALDRAYDAGMTKFATEKEYQPTGTLTREQAAKMYAVFGMSYLCLAPDTSRACTFSDVNSADPSLQEFLKTSCQLGLFQWSQGKFSPKSPLTKAQALTVLVRALSGSVDETTNPRRKNYFTQAQSLQLTKETNVWAVDKSVTRYESLLLQYRARNKWCNTTQDNYSPQLLEILQQLLWPNDPLTDDSDIAATGDADTWSTSGGGTGSDT